jgi:DNA-binding transcriptional regulator YiaG
VHQCVHATKLNLEFAEMKREPISGIQPSILRWARQSIGLSLLDVAHAMKKPASAIEAWEEGLDAPTYPQLEKLA